MKKRFFVRRVAVYLFTMLIPIVLLFAAFEMITIRNVNESLREQGRRTVEGGAVNFDLVLSNVWYQNDLLTSTARMNLSLQRMLNREQLSYGDAVNIDSLRSILRSISDSHEYIDSIYIYLDGGSRFFSSKRGIVTIREGEDTGWLSMYEAMEPGEDGAMEERTGEEGSLLSVCRRLTLQKGCIVVNLNVEMLCEILKKQLSNPDETLFLVNRAGEVLAEASGVRREPVQRIEAENGRWVSLGSERCLTTLLRYDTMDVSFISAISRRALNREIAAALPLFGALLAADVAVAVGLAYFTTKRSFDQISYLIHVFDEAEKGLPVQKPDQRSRDEYDVIMNNVIYLFLNTNYLNLKLMENQARQTRTEMMALQLQINPHFIFNTLQTLDMEVRREQTPRETVSRIVRSLSGLLKYALGNPMEQVRVEEEIYYLKQYVTIQKYRFGDQFILYYEVDEEARRAMVFRLFLQPLVENSLLHGIRPLGHRGYIRVSIRKRGERLLCTVTDTGVGMDRGQLETLLRTMQDETSRGIGLTNLYRRLVLQYGTESRLRVRSKRGMGTSISFQIPFSADESAETSQNGDGSIISSGEEKK